MPPSKIVRRLEKLLLVVPYVVRHPGSRLEELARLFGVPEDRLVEDLNLLFLTGLPPYGPGDLIDVDVEDGRVWIRMADYFSRPVRLTATEAVGLYLRGVTLLGLPGLEEAEALRSALDKLRSHLGDVLEPLQVQVEGAPVGPAAGTLGAVRRAVESSERIEIDHYSAARDEVVTRRIDPEHVFAALGNWYVVAWCHLVDGERLFRIDRIRDIRPTGETFEPRGLAGRGRPLYAPGRGDVRVRLRLRPLARWVAEYYEVEERREDGDVLEVVLPTKDLAWLAKLLLRLEGQVEVVEPEALRALTRTAVDGTLARYG